VSRALIVLKGNRERDKAIGWIKSAPYGTRVEFKHSKRTLPQNDFMWSLLTDVAEQVPWHGVRLRPDDYKILFLDALKRELRMVPNLNGDGFCQLGRSSSDLSKTEMADMIELIIAWGTEKGVTFKLLPDAGVSPGETEKNAG
jgi:hypothetical protein